MRQPFQYNKIFSESTDLKVWPIIAMVLRIADTQLESVRPKQKTNIKSYLKSIRYVISLLAISRLMGKFDFSVNDLISLDISLYTPQLVNNTWCSIQEYLPAVWNKSNWKRKEFTFELLAKASKKFSIANFNSISKRDDSFLINLTIEFLKLMIHLLHKSIKSYLHSLGLLEFIKLLRQNYQRQRGKVANNYSTYREGTRI